MRRENRMNSRKQNDNNKLKGMLYLGGSILGLAVMAFVITFSIYRNNQFKHSTSNLDSGKIADLVPNNTTNTTKEASTQMGKRVEESKNEMNTTNNAIQNADRAEENTTNTTKTNTTKTNTTKEENAGKKTEKKETGKEENKQPDPNFVRPVDGDIIKEFAKDNLVYSQTLHEWVTHQGIDIKAEKTAVVKAAADGKVKAIKNDPRYGLTIVMEHANGYTSIYANLLTSEFVVEGENVKQGQTIGTVGNTAAFEIADESHLHFEILKDNVAVDPNFFIK